jgi:hypothetical protein
MGYISVIERYSCIRILFGLQIDMVINEQVTVGIVNNVPKYVIWKGRSHTISKIGLHHHFREGNTLYHVFSVATNTLFLRLKLNTDNLQWTLEETNENGI